MSCGGPVSVSSPRKRGSSIPETAVWCTMGPRFRGDDSAENGFALPCVGAAGDGVTDAERHGVDQHEDDAGALVTAVGPGVIGPALDHHVSRLQLHRGVVHVHL